MRDTAETDRAELPHVRIGAKHPKFPAKSKKKSGVDKKSDEVSDDHEECSARVDTNIVSGGTCQGGYGTIVVFLRVPNGTIVFKQFKEFLQYRRWGYRP
jgi:hypothetical protein